MFYNGRAADYAVCVALLAYYNYSSLNHQDFAGFVVSYPLTATWSLASLQCKYA